MKAVLVTAGHVRIGKEIAVTLSRAGFYIFIHHHNSEAEAIKLLEGFENGGEVVQCDLGDYADVERMLADIEKSDHALCHVVNNASLFSADEILDFTEDSFQNHMNVNLRGPMQLARGLYEMLEKKEIGSVVNILDSKVFSLNADYASYTLSKHGLFGATELMAQALSPRLRVNGVAPGMTLIAEGQSAECFEMASHLNFNGSPLDVQDIVDTVLHLINSKSINGAVIPVDGGQKMMNFTKDVVDVAAGILKKN
ncbi:MAG: SDR family oxidoreductase [Emcibacteraceae bacterium]|nr:SDR family oxidoreductase [Emcibacteraceae bacterium]MDG1996053.1 SDR family oxidoreductase [Emcibacteraceae bacterium]